VNESDRFLRAFRFKLQLRQSSGGTELGDGHFQEVTGLEVELDIAEHLEGGRNDGVVKHLGRAKYHPLVLKRGMFHSTQGELNRDLWRWLQDLAAGVRPVRRYDGTVQVCGRNLDEVLATWQFERGLPLRLRGPELNGKTGEIAIEELHIAHEGLRLV
jgi:phage tail-like protein